MLKAYFDASGKGASDVFVLAGYISTVERWERFTEDWGAELKGGKDAKKRQPIKVFKLRKMDLTAGPSLRRCAIFNKIAHEHAIARVACVVDVAAFFKVLKTSWWSEVYETGGEHEDVYWFAFRGITEAFQLARNQHKLNAIDGPIDFIFDRENESDNAAIVAAWERLYKTSDPAKQMILGNPPNFERDDLVLPLQAADLVAGVARRIALTGKSIMHMETPWSREDVKRILTVTMEYGEADIQRNLDRVIAKRARLLLYKRKWGWIS